MCLIGNAKATKAFRSPKTFIAYKVVIRNSSWNCYTAQYTYSLGAVYQYYTYKEGVNTPIEATIPMIRKNKTINGGGLHVYIKRSDAEKLARRRSDSRIVPVICSYSDVIAVDRDNEQAVVKKFTITTDAYNRAMKAKKL